MEIQNTPLSLSPRPGPHNDLGPPASRVCATDTDAIRQFLAGYQSGSPHTLRAYTKEVMRFALWLRFIWPGCQDGMARVTPSTIRDYLAFLEGRGTLPSAFLAQEGWPRRVPPFSGKDLKVSTKALVLHVLRALFDTLANLEGPGGQAYCRFNPMRGGRGFGVSALQQGFRPTERGLTFEEWGYVTRAIQSTAGDLQRVRDRWVILFLYMTFLRRSEASSVRMGDFRLIRGGWRLRVVGKGGKEREIVAVSSLMRELAAYRVAHGLPPLPKPDESTPAIGRIVGLGGIQTGSIYLTVRRVCEAAASLAQANGREDIAQTLRSVSPHWLRHTGISHAMERGVEPRYVQAQAGHSSLAITGLYDHKDKDAWAQSMERLAK
jgi:integrase